MPLTLSTIYGGASGSFRKSFGLISSASTDGTALSLTIAHSLGAAVPGLNATNATQLIDVNFNSVGDSSADGAFGWFLASVNETSAIVGRSSVQAGQDNGVLTHCVIRYNQSIIQ